MPTDDPAREQPLLSAIIVTLVGGHALARCLASIGREPAECLVIGPYADEIGGTGNDRVRCIKATAPVPRLRAQGLAEVRGRWVLVIEDSCELHSGWYQSFAAACRPASVAALGGPVSISTLLTARCLALACVEYGEFASDAIASSVVQRIAGLCVFYRLTALAELDLAAGLIESETFRELLRAGNRLEVHRGLEVRYFAEDRIAATATSRFTHGRIYGGGLRHSVAGIGRVLAILKCAALPPVLYLRAARGLPATSKQRAAVHSWIFAFACAWSAGEFTGLLLGRGAALEGWRQ